MKTRIQVLAFSVILFCGISSAQETSGPLSGTWVRMTQTGPVALEFQEGREVAVDFGNDGSTDVVTNFEIDESTIHFNDTEGEMCPEQGSYWYQMNDYYVAFDLTDDMCNGRINMTMGFWTKPNFEELIEELTKEISEAENHELNLTRARIYMALGRSNEAKADLDVYLDKNPNDARALINRAGTRFPMDMQGAVSDCNRAIDLEPDNKNAWFLRGLARYELGEEEQACADFSRAIELGFSILRIAEEQRCAEIWEE